MNLMIENSGYQSDSNPLRCLHYFLAKLHREKFPTCISPGLHFFKGTRHNVGLSYFVAAHAEP